MPTHQVDKWGVALAVWPEPSVCIFKTWNGWGWLGGEGGGMTQREIGKTREIAWTEFQLLLQKIQQGVSKTQNWMLISK